MHSVGGSSPICGLVSLKTSGNGFCLAVLSSTWLFCVDHVLSLIRIDLEVNSY